MLGGIRAALRGATLALTTPDVRAAYRRLALAVLLVSLGLQAAGLWGVFSLLDFGSDGWAEVGSWVARIVASIVVLLVSPVVALVLTNMAFPVLGERLFFVALARRSPAVSTRLAPHPDASAWESLTSGLLRMRGFLGWTMLAFVVGWVPVVGPVVSPAVQLWVSARYLSWELVLPYLERRGMSYVEQKAFVAAHRGALFGFGVVFAPALAVPLVGPLAFGVAQAAAACLVADELGETPTNGRHDS